MECPKCIGKLQPLNLRIYELPQLTDMPHAFSNWGTAKQTVFKECARKDNLELDRCFVCKGIWFDKGELKKIRKEKPDKKTVASFIDDPKLYKGLNEKSGLCPRCKKPMRKVKGQHALRKVTIDVCAKCGGTWLDGGEVNFILKGGSKQKFVNFWRYLYYDRFIPE